MIGVIIPGSPLITGGPLPQNNLIVDVNDPKNVKTLKSLIEK